MNQESQTISDFETWIRYLKAKFQQNTLDFSALRRLLNILVSHKDDLKILVQNLLYHLDTELESNGVIILHTINAIVINLRRQKSGDLDANFVGTVIGDGDELLIKNLRKDWQEFRMVLSWTLQEWSKNYKFKEWLAPELSSLIPDRCGFNFKNIHYTIIEEKDAIKTFYKSRIAEQLSNNVLRVWIHTINNTEVKKDIYSDVFLDYRNNEGLTLVSEYAKKYVEDMLTNSDMREKIFVNLGVEKFMLIIFGWLNSYSGAFIESAVGVSVRSIISVFENSDYRTYINSDEFRNLISELINFIRYALENLQNMSPMLAKFICELVDNIIEIKQEEAFWDEMYGLIVKRLLQPAITNPIMAGIHDFTGLDSSKALVQCSVIIQHAWQGIPFESRDLKEVIDISWFNEKVQEWNSDLRRSFGKLYRTRRSEPRDLTFPKALLIHDLRKIQNGFIQEDLAIINKEVPLSSFGGHHQIEEEIPEEIDYEEDFVKGSSFPGLTPPDPMECSTPSVAALPAILAGEETPRFDEELPRPPSAKKEGSVIEIVRDVEQSWELPAENITSDLIALWNGSKQIQSDDITSQHLETQTDIAETTSTPQQTDSKETSTQAIQTKSLETRVMLRSSHKRHADVETMTSLNLDRVYYESDNLVKEVEALKAYQNTQQDRDKHTNDYWSSQLSHLKDENEDLKFQIQSLKEQIGEFAMMEKSSPAKYPNEYYVNQTDPKIYLNFETPSRGYYRPLNYSTSEANLGRSHDGHTKNISYLEY